MPPVCKPKYRTKGHNKTEKQDLSRKVINNKIEGRGTEPSLVKKLGPVEEVCRPGQENQTEAH